MKLRSIAVPIMAWFIAMFMFTCQAHAAPHTVLVKWSAPLNQTGITVTGYKVYRGTATGAEGTTAFATVTGGTVLSFTDTAVTGGTTYFYQITATLSCDSTVWDCSAFVPESAKSNEAASGVVPLPPAPTGNAPTAATATIQ